MNAMCCQEYGIWKLHAILAMKKADAVIKESILALFGQIKNVNTMMQESYFLVHTHRNSYTYTQSIYTNIDCGNEA